MRDRHTETQVYVAAFQYLGWKQLEHDKMRNENINTIRALEYLLTLAKNLLCEIETAINNSAMKVPTILTQEVMFKRLTFRNNNRDRKTSFDIDEIDTKFAKIRFGEYLHGLEQVLKNRLGKRHPKNKQTRKNTQLRKKAGNNNGADLAIAATANGIGKPVRIPYHRNHLKNPNNNSVHSGAHWPRRHPMHRNNNGSRHRNRSGMRKQRRNRKPFQNDVAGLGPNEIRNFRRSHRKSTTTRTKLAAAAAVASSSRTQNNMTVETPQS